MVGVPLASASRRVVNRCCELKNNRVELNTNARAKRTRMGNMAQILLTQRKSNAHASSAAFK
jgi:hypothetical protein